LNKRKIGKVYEDIAVQYLEQQGVRILEKNYSIAQGEVDIIAETLECVIFVEVKYRKNALFGQPWEAVSKEKQQKICKVARQFCYTRKINKQIRFDVISICGEEIFWFQDAFFYT